MLCQKRFQEETQHLTSDLHDYMRQVFAAVGLVVGSDIKFTALPPFLNLHIASVIVVEHFSEGMLCNSLHCTCKIYNCYIGRK